MADLEDPFLNVDCSHLKSFDSDLYRQLVSYPQEVIPTLDMTVNELFFEKYPDVILPHQIQVRPYCVDKTKNMRSLNPEGNSHSFFLRVHHCLITEPIFCQQTLINSSASVEWSSEPATSFPKCVKLSSGATCATIPLLLKWTVAAFLSPLFAQCAILAILSPSSTIARNSLIVKW